MKRIVVLALASASVLATLGCAAQATRDFSMAGPWQDCERLVVRTRNGRVSVAVADVNEVRVDGQKRVRGVSIGDAQKQLDALEIVVGPDEQSPGTFVVELRVPASLAERSPGCDFVIKVPAPCAADVHTSNGSIVAEGLRGQAVLETSNGSIRVRDLAGNLRADTCNARIDVRGVRGDVVAKTSNGSVVVRENVGNCQVETANGSVDVVAEDGNVQLSTSNATIQADVTPREEGSVVLDTSNGTIYLTVPADMKAEMQLDTSNGALRAERRDVPYQVKRQTHDHLRAALNGGGNGRIKAETSNGSITVDFR